MISTEEENRYLRQMVQTLYNWIMDNDDNLTRNIVSYIQYDGPVDQEAAMLALEICQDYRDE